MRFFHLSDLHIGLKLITRDLSEDQRVIFEQICAQAQEKKPQAIVIAGDLYDKSVPSAEAVHLFDELIEKLTEAVPEAQIMMISGNHDSQERIDLFRSVLKKQRIHMIGLPPVSPEESIEKVVLQDEYGRVNFYLLPFVKPSMVKAIVGCDENGNNLSYNETLHRLIEREKIDPSVRNVLVSHQFYLPIGQSADGIERMDSEIRMAGNIDEVKADILERFDYAALGHIHKPMKVGSDFIRYCGTSLACSFSEASQQKAILMVDMLEKGNVAVSEIPLHPLHEMKVITGSMQEVLLQGCSDYVKVVLTDALGKDSYDVLDRIRQAFPNLLEISRTSASAPVHANRRYSAEKSVLELCTDFLEKAGIEVGEQEQTLLGDIINAVKEDHA